MKEIVEEFDDYLSCNLKDKMKMYSEALMGTGFSVFFITTLCTATLFKTFDDLTCIFIGAIILLLAYSYGIIKTIISARTTTVSVC